MRTSTKNGSSYAILCSYAAVLVGWSKRLNLAAAIEQKAVLSRAPGKNTLEKRRKETSTVIVSTGRGEAVTGFFHLLLRRSIAHFLHQEPLLTSPGFASHS
jgi:hypothetical protein